MIIGQLFASIATTIRSRATRNSVTAAIAEAIVGVPAAPAMSAAATAVMAAAMMAAG